MENLFTRRSAIITLVVTGTITLFFLLQAPRLRLDFDFERFFPTRDPQLDFYLSHREKFETDNDFLLVGIRPQKGVFNHAFLTRLDSLCNSLNALPSVTGAYAITNYQQPVSTPFGMTPATVLSLHGGDYTQDSLYLCSDPLVKGNLLSEDCRSVVIMLRNKPYINKKEGDTLLFAVEKTIGKQSGEEIHLAGKIHGQYHYVSKMGDELVFFSVISILLLAGFLWFTFRRAWGVWVPLTIVGCTITWLLGIIVLTGQKLSVLTIILPTILFVVGISDTVHLLEKYIEELRHGKNKIKALISAYKEVGTATFFTCLTTAVGFFTLASSSIGPIIEFAIFTGSGVWIAFILSYTLLPALVLLLPPPGVAEKKVQYDYWTRMLRKLLIFVFNNRKKIVAGVVLLILLAIGGITRLKINNYLLEDWSRDDPQKKDYVFFEEHFAGVRPFELSVKVRNDSLNLLDYSVLHDIHQVEQYLQKSYGVSAISSPVTLLKSLNRAIHGGDNAWFTFPGPEDYNMIRADFRRAMHSPRAGTFVTPDLKECRINARGTDFGGYIFKQKNAALDEFIRHKTNPQVQFRQTGMAMLIDRNNQNLSTDMILELGLSFAFIALLMSFLFRSVPMLVISLIPNTIPLLLVAGIMGYAGIDLKVSTSIIFSIAFGIAVDDTIHFLSALRLELSRGRSLVFAIRRTYLSTGKAVVVTGLILCSGFVSLIFSSFASTFYLGLLVSITLFIALLCDLLLLPVLLLWWYKPGLQGREE